MNIVCHEHGNVEAVHLGNGDIICGVCFQTKLAELTQTNPVEHRDIPAKLPGYLIP